MKDECTMSDVDGRIPCPVCGRKFGKLLWRFRSTMESEVQIKCSCCDADLTLYRPSASYQCRKRLSRSVAEGTGGD